MSSSQRREYHIVVLGAGGVGKSCLTAQFVQGIWIESYDPTIEDSYRKQIEVDGRQCMLEILDTAGTEQFTAMRELYMKTGQGFLLVFSITSLSSLSELGELREQIVRIKDDEDVPIVMVGNKSDLEDDRTVPRATAFGMSQSWGNAPYYETSARRRANVDEVFIDLCRQIMDKDKHQYGHGRGRIHARRGTLGEGGCDDIDADQVPSGGGGRAGCGRDKRDPSYGGDNRQARREQRRRRRKERGCVVL